MTVQGSVVASLLGTTIDILAGADAVAGVNASDLPREVVLNASALNAQLGGQVSAFGLVDLDLAADVCPSGSIDGLAVSNITVTYLRGGSNATVAPEPLIAAIAVNGDVGAQVASDQGLTLALRTDEALNGSSQVDWYIDGKLAGSGETLTSVAFSKGEHTVETRATAGAFVHTYSTTVNATAQAEAQAQIAINGAVTTAVKSGESLILELRTPQPLAANASVEWFVDGKLVARGQVVAGVELSPGIHSVEARENSSGTVHSYAAQVTAAGTAPTAGLAAAVLVSAALCLCAIAAIAWRRRR